MDRSLAWTKPRPAAWLLVLGIFLLGAAGGCGPDRAETREALVYVGTGSGDPDEGIYPFSFDSTSGKLRQLQGPTYLLNPTFLAFAPDGQHLYSVRETTDSARVHAFGASRSSGRLRPLNNVPAGGGAPCYISVDATGQWVLTANYVGGNVAVFPVREDGGLGPATQVVQHEGTGADPERQQMLW